jgi:polysaccharide export outer membrane protein
VFERNTVELCDLSHSFLVRDGKRVPVDFDRLFQRGDLAQNVAMEPEDYLYFALASANEVYVFGEVVNPGTAAFLPQSTAIGAIASRGGYTQKAFRSRVLVARGSLNHPECFVVDTSAILKGKAPDFRLQPKDIVYVSKSPWAKAEEIIDIAATAFITGFTVGTVARKFGPYFTTPLIP